MESLKKFTNELREIISTKFDFEIQITNTDFTIWISYDLYEHSDIPITYNTEFSYFNWNKFIERLKYNKIDINDIEYGFDSDEIETINKLCKYLTDNKDVVDEIINIMCRED